jgi:hypothetical protein
MSNDLFSGGDSNPYGASEGLTSNALKPASRPTSATVFGALNIAMGVLGLCGVGGGFVQMLIPSDMLQPPGSPPNPVFTVMDDNPGLKIFMVITLSIGLITTVMLIIAGLGLLNDKRSGRTLSVYYSIISILMVIVGAIGNYFLLMKPLMDLAASMPEGPEKFAAMVGAYSGIFGSCFSLVYPILLLIFMMRKSVVDYYDSTNK